MWEAKNTNSPFEYHFLDQTYDNLYKRERQLSAMLSDFALLAILIATLGLFGLASFITEQKTKEIGICKVLGASVHWISILVSKEFAKWVLIANLIVWPIAYYTMNKWLQNFSYRIDLRWWMFALAGGIALAIAKCYDKCICFPPIYGQLCMSLE